MGIAKVVSVSMNIAALAAGGNCAQACCSAGAQLLLRPPVHSGHYTQQWDRVTNQRIGQEDVHKCKIRSHNGTRVTNQRIGQEDVHKCKICSHSGTRVTNQHIGQEDVHKYKIRSHSETRATNQRIGQEDVHKTMVL